MKLYIDDQEVVFPGRQDVNMTFRFLDTYNPSAIKTSYSKTISLPDTPENARIFSTQKVRHSFSLFEDNGARLLEKGYCILDRVKSVGIVKTYEITLYGGLGDFFYNLKGDEDKPKTLADLYWGDITGMTKVREDLDPIMTWDNEYVYNTWFSSSFNSVWDTFRAVPCIYDDKILNRSLSIVPAEGGLFPSSSSDGEGSPFVGLDGSEALLVEADDNTLYGKQDFRSDLMPLGIKYRSIIETICNPENNGGYEVSLDPNFFNETNPYWNNMFLLKGLPTLDYDYSVKSSSLSSFSSSFTRVGNYQGDGTSTSKETTIEPTVATGVWEPTGTGGLELQEGVTIFKNRVSYKIPILVHLAQDLLLGPRGEFRYLKFYSYGYLQASLKIVNLDTLQEQTLESKTLKKPLEYFTTPVALQPSSVANTTVTSWFEAGILEGVAEIPVSWTRFRIKLVLTAPKASAGYRLMNNQGGTARDVAGDLCGPSYHEIYSGLPDSILDLNTEYIANSTAFDSLKFTKKDLLSGTKTPFDYLVWYTKMFNLRFYLEPGNKRVSIFLPEDFIQQYSPVDIQDKICYDREYSRTRRIIDEGFLKFNLTPNKNDTVEAYQEVYGDTLFDGTYAVPLVEGKGQKEYLNSDLKVGSQARKSTSFAFRKLPSGYLYCGFNQGSPYNVSYIKEQEEEREIGGEIVTVVETVHTEEEHSLNQEVQARYDFLELGDSLSDTVVMYSGLKALPFWEEKGYDGIISRTSVDMVRFAGAPCWISGWVPRSPGLHSSLLGADCIHVSEYPVYGIVPSTRNYDWGLTYQNVNYDSIIATGNIYDKYLKTFIENVYSDPLVVECYVRLLNPDFRKLYWFDNNYWILVEVNNFNYRDEPVKCKFIRYRTDV